MWIKTLLENVDRIIHGGKHYPVVDGIADVPKEVRDDLIGQTHIEDVKEEIAPETVKAVQEANKAAGVEKDLPEVIEPEEDPKEPEKDPEPSEDASAPEEDPKGKKTTKTTKTK